jgi:hypothetical protein
MIRVFELQVELQLIFFQLHLKFSVASEVVTTYNVDLLRDS